MQRIGAAPGQRIDDCVGVQVALRRGLTAKRIGLVGQPDVQGISVEFAVDGDGENAKVATCANDPDSDFTTIGDEYLVEHGQ